MAKLGYTWYPKDWGNSESVFELNLAERGLYRELIDLAMLSDNKTEFKKDIWQRKFGVTNTELEQILDKLIRLKLIEINDNILFIPSCESRLNLSRGGSKGGKKSKPPMKPNDKPILKPVESLCKKNEKPIANQREREKKYKVNNTIMSDKSDDHANDLFKKYIDFYNLNFNKKFTTKSWEKKSLTKFKQVLKIYKSDLGKNLVVVVKNIKEDEFHIKNEFKYATPEYILRPEVFEKFLNLKPLFTKWKDPSEVYLCADWIKRIPKPPVRDTPEYYRFVHDWKIQELQQNEFKQKGEYTNLDCYAE